MRLYVNLFPALGYALVTMFSNMAGLTGEVPQSTKKQQVVALQSCPQKSVRLDSFVWTAKNGHLLLSSGSGSSNLVWMIPNSPGTGLVNLLSEMNDLATYVVKLTDAGKSSSDSSL